VRLVDWLATLAEPSGTPAEPGDDPTTKAGAEEVAEASAILAEAAGGFCERLDALGVRPWPINVTQRLVTSIHRCEQLAVEESADSRETDSWEAFRGRALDAYVCHAIHAGAVADPVEDLRSHWIATDRPGDIEALDGHMACADASAKSADLEALAARALEFSHLGDRVARVEVTLAATVDDSIRLPGRIDVLLDGPGTPRPAVLVEVKSTRPRADHAAQLRHYVMLAALVHGSMPAAAALWYPGDPASRSPQSCVEVPVAGTVASSAKRVAGALSRLGELWQGRVPERSGGSHCTWCPLAAECPQARRGETWESPGG
jgi:hypothetical protein